MPLNVFSQVNGNKIDFKTIRSGHTDKYKSTSRTIEIIDSREDLVEVWIELYIRMLPIPEIPDIDFEEEIVIIFLGEKDNLGSKSRIDDITIREYPTYISITYEEIVAGPGCKIPGKRAFRLIRVQNLIKSITFEKTERESESCFATIN